MNSHDPERIVRVEEQLRWMAPRVERIETKLDHLLGSHLSFKWKVIGASSIIGFLASLLVELVRK